MSADPAVYLKDQYTLKSPNKRNTTKGSPSIRRPQGLPHKPTYKTVPPNTKKRSQHWPEYLVYLTHRHTDGVPQKHKRNTTKGSPSIRRPRDLPQTPTCRNVEKKNRNTTKGSPSIRRHRGLPHRPTYWKVAQKEAPKTLPKAAQASANTGVYLTNQHTGKSPRKTTDPKIDPPRKRKHCQQQPEYPQTPGLPPRRIQESTTKCSPYPQTPASALQTNKSPPPKKKEALSKAAPASADPGIYLTNQHAEKSPQKRQGTPSILQFYDLRTL